MANPRTCELYPHQVEGVEFLHRPDTAHKYLADDMGLGKTVQAATALHCYPYAKRVLVAAPASAGENWKAELEDWAPGDRAYMVRSYDKVTRDVGEIAKWNPDLTILDEAHYCKSPGAKRTRAALRLAANSKNAWLLSGTPMPNHPGELYPPVRMLWPEVLQDFGIRNYQQWLETFCLLRPTPYGPKPYGVKPENATRLRAHLDRFMLRRKLADVALDLPELRVTLQWLPANAEMEKRLEDVEYDDSEEVYTSTLRRLLGEAKAPLIARQIAEELEDGQYPKVVVLYHHKAVGSELRIRLDQYGISGFDGSTPGGDRQRAIQWFQTDPRCRVFLAQQTAAREAINLTAATEIVLVEPDWVPDMNAQAIKRIHRIGQGHPCRARIFAVRDTLDAAIMRGIHQKVRMQETVGIR
jgi:SWI/SNF-related matrix-associated actin-dependent regulator of chromatin subfamily A-like protein 1